MLLQQLQKSATFIYFLLMLNPLVLGDHAFSSSEYRLLKLGDVSFYARLAITEEARTQGLMNCKVLPENHGVLFIFEQPGQYGFWMAHTSLNLDIAFIDAQGVLCQICPLYPFNHNPVFPKKPILYALEMNRGWFAANNIQVGAQLDVVLLQGTPQRH